MGRSHILIVLIISLVIHSMSATEAIARKSDQQIVESARIVLNEIMANPQKQIPRSLLKNGQGIVIVPAMLKGGFVIGVRHGRGVALIRDPKTGFWNPPTFITMTGGSFGWQAGIQSADVIMVFKTQKGVTDLMTGKFKIGADASAAAGPVGREASAATDGKFQAEILSWSRSRGLFLGVSLEGSVLNVDHASNNQYYASTGVIAGQPLEPGKPIPASAAGLITDVSKYSVQTNQPTDVTVIRPTEPVAVTPVSPTGPPTAQPVVTGPSLTQEHQLEAIREHIAEASDRLYPDLSQEWQNYLKLPAGFNNPSSKPTKEAVVTALNNYEAVAADEKYAELSNRSEFQTVRFGLKSYLKTMEEVSSRISLPPPPKFSSPGEYQPK